MAEAGRLSLGTDDVFKIDQESFFTLYEPIYYLRFSFLFALAVFIVLFPLYRSRKSFFDVIAVKKTMPALRGFILLLSIAQLYLLYCVYFFGSPIPASPRMILSFTRGLSWIYFYTRPISGILLSAAGVVAEMHPLFRFLPALGCISDIIFGSISSFQVYDYYTQSLRLNAPKGLYTTELLYFYFIREIISFGLSFVVLFHLIYLSSILGIYAPQNIPYSLIIGGDINRPEMMRKQRDIRNNIGTYNKDYSTNYVINGPAFASSSKSSSSMHDEDDLENNKDFDDGDYSDNDSRTLCSVSRLLRIYKIVILSGLLFVGIIYLLVYLDIIKAPFHIWLQRSEKYPS
jgi:hypothetical protein